MKRFVLRIIYSELKRFLRLIRPVSSVRIPSNEIVTARRLVSKNESRVSSYLGEQKVEVLYQQKSDFGSTFYVHASSARKVLAGMRRLHGEGLCGLVTFYLRSKRRKMRLDSLGMVIASKYLLPERSIEEIAFYHLVSAPGSRVTLHRSFASKVRFVVPKDGWWVNRWSDVGSSPVQIECIDRLKIPEITKVTFPIDLVYTWVDGSDNEWSARRDAVIEGLGRKLPRRSANRSRWENRDELLYSLRSVALYAPWIRNIYILTDQQVPTWLHQSARIRVIDHRDVFPPDSVLPTYNSHAIESVLHRIEGLSEHFLYMNDDFFFGDATSPEDFFTSGGLSKVFYSKSFMPVGSPVGREKASEWGGINASRLIEEALGRSVRRKIKHTPLALRKSVLDELEERFPTAFREVRRSQFRCMEDIAPLTALYVNYAVSTGRAVSTGISYSYFDIGQRSLVRKLDAFVRRPAKVFCLNDTEEYLGGVSWEEKTRIVQAFLGELYPWPAPWEALSQESVAPSRNVGLERQRDVSVPGV